MLYFFPLQSTSGRHRGDVQVRQRSKSLELFDGFVIPKPCRVTGKSDFEAAVLMFLFLDPRFGVKETSWMNLTTDSAWTVP